MSSTRHALIKSGHSRRSVSCLAASLSAAAALVVPMTSATASAHRAAGSCSPAPSAVVAWDATASAALGTDAALPAPIMAIGMAYTQAAVYDAVNGITSARPLYRWHSHGPRFASTDAAVVAAAHRWLVTYFPVANPRVEAAYGAALDAIPDGAAKTAGVAYGELAAQHLIDQRAGDGWQAPVVYDQPALPGVWRPTPPALAPYLGTWLGVMKPFLMRSASQFRPSGPPALTSRRYARDLREVADLGSATSTTRTAEQAEIARFFGGNLSTQLQEAYRDHVTRHCLGESDAARYFAVASMAGADGVIASWDAKLFFHFWRPITAIQLADTDGNPATVSDPTWTPLLVTPPFPDYLSGHTTVIGAVTAALTRLSGTSQLDLNLSSTVTGTTRHYQDASTLNAEGIGARIWGGIHFRTADEVGARVGARVGAWDSRRFD